MTHIHARLARTSAIGLALTLLPFSANAQQSEEEEQVTLAPVILSAEEQLKQAPGVSTITSEDLQRQPVANDISEIIRKMPGVNLTGTSASGQRGNQRQIDIRGMGPENTLILIDGKPVLSRNSVRMGRAGERDSRGDTNWVPAEMIERIEVLRGPAAARYGSGASGGVVNIVTKRPDVLSGMVGMHFNMPESSAEGGDQRYNFMVGGPINEKLAFRLWGGYTKSDPDDPLINSGADTSVCEVDGEEIACPAAGVEGVENKDIGALLTWEVAPGHSVDFEFGFSRQGNRFAGDRQNASVNGALVDLANEGAETNRMYRRTLSATHRGEYSFGSSTSYIQWENTRNNRLCEGLAGGPEGSISYCVDTDGDGVNDAVEWRGAELDNITAKTEWQLPGKIMGRDQVLTLGAEYRGEFMDDHAALRQNVSVGEIPGIPSDAADRDTKSDQSTIGVYAESNIYWNDEWTITPGLRFDYNDNFGGNVSPSLNAAWQINDDWSLKLGVARAFKAPNLFQLNPNYVYYTMGNGCPVGWTNGDWPGQQGCYVVGNPDLEPETSINKEIGIAYNNAGGISAGVTYFHNDYRDKIQAGLTPIGSTEGGTSFGRLFRWDNIPKAVVEGLEANLSLPFFDEAVVWRTNATYMINSENKSNGQPLSLVPDYTVNSAVDWRATDEFTLTASLTWYGTTPAPTVSGTMGSDLENTDSRPPYSLVSLGGVYDLRENVTISGGITNLFNKQILREGSGNAAGSNTWNEPGRAFYIGVNARF